MQYIEHRDQATVVRWWGLQFPHLEKLLVHIPNGQNIGARRGARLRSMGLRAGYPDLQLCMPKIDTQGALRPGLFVEMKTQRGRLSTEQKEVKELLESQGYLVEVCRSSEEAIEVIKSYVALKHAG